MHRVLALWASPRSLSTAFERMMIERGDHEVFDEPFSETYYFSEERVSDRFDEPTGGSRADEVVESLWAAARRRPVFFKDMAYHAVPYLGPDVLGEFVHTFLVRDPRWAVPSLARRWPDFTDDEVGIQRQLELFEAVRDATGETPPVIDADSLRGDPHGVIQAWCDTVGIGFVPEALSWSPGMQPQWQRWADWYGDVSRSTGFRPPASAAPPVVDDERVVAAIDAVMPAYEVMAARAITAYDRTPRA